MPARPVTSFGLGFARVFWMLLGPVLLLLLTAGIVTRWRGWVTGPDLLYFAVLGGMLLARWVEFRGGESQTADGEPATPADLRRYLLVGTAAGIAVWVAANLLGRLELT